MNGGPPAVGASPLPRAYVTAIAAIAGPDRDLLERLWTERRLQATDRRRLDEVDELAARLAVLQLNAGKSVCIVLPTTQPDRAPLILATALLSHWFVAKLTGNAASLAR